MFGIRFLLLGTVLGLSFLLNQQQQLAFAAPQDLQTAALLAAGQISDMINNGAKAGDKKSMDFAGIFKVKSETEVGFGDAMKESKDRRRKRAADEKISSDILEEAESSSGLSAERNKRDADSDSSSSASSSESNE